MMGDFDVALLNRRRSLIMPKIKKCGFNEQRDVDKFPAVFVTSVAWYGCIRCEINPHLLAHVTLLKRHH
jgi:hypothetical protein